MTRWAVLLTLLYVSAAMAQNGASVEVRLTDGRRTVSSAATLRLWPSNRFEQTDERGKAIFDELSSGDYRIEASAEGYASRDTSFELAPGERLDLSLQLQKVAVTLPEIVVETGRPTQDVIVFSRKHIASSSARSLPDFLTNVAGLDVRTDGTVGSAESVRIGGSNTDQVLVLVDGQRLRDLGNGEADLSAIPLEWVESIEVSRGSRTDAGGEAIGGILRITSRRVSDRDEMSAVAEAYPTYQRLSFLRSANAGWASGLLSYSRTQGPGNYKYTVSEEDGNGPFTVNLGKSFHRANASIARDQLLAKLSTDMPNGLIEATGTMDIAARGMPGYITQPTRDARQNSSQEALNVQATRAFGKLDIQVRGAFQHDWKEYNDPDTYSLVHSASESSGEWEGELRGTSTVERMAVSGGVLSTRESLTSEQIIGGRAYRVRWASWAQIGRPLISSSDQIYILSGNAGLRWERYGGGQAVLPKLSLTFEQSAIHGGANIAWGKSYRAPSFYSLFWLDDQLAQGNPDLRSEVSTEWTGRAYVDPPWLHGLHTELNASDQDVENLIYWKRTFDNRWKPFNLKQAHVKTLDASVSQTALRDHIQLSAGINWTEARDATGDRNSGRKYLSFRAPRSYRSTVTLKDHGFELAANYRWVSARPVFDTNYKWLQEYQVGDFRIVYAFRLRQLRVEPAIGANNLFNENYRIVRFAPMPGSEFYVSVRVSEN